SLEPLRKCRVVGNGLQTNPVQKEHAEAWLAGRIEDVQGLAIQRLLRPSSSHNEHYRRRGLRLAYTSRLAHRNPAAKRREEAVGSERELVGSIGTDPAAELHLKTNSGNVRIEKK